MWLNFGNRADTRGQKKMAIYRAIAHTVKEQYFKQTVKTVALPLCVVYLLRPLIYKVSKLFTEFRDVLVEITTEKNA